ncbi:MAG: MFS transporter [Desulfobulbaceae bacterium]|nr:MFS transporter [Desulfobulbaceae bacterium]
MTNDSRLVWMVGFSHFITHGYMTILPAVLIAIATEQSLSFTELGVIATVGYFLYGLGAFPAGYLADRFGSKRLLTMGVLGMALSSILVGLSSSMIIFAITYALLGASASIHHPAGLSLIARRIDSNKGRAMGFHGVMGNIGLFLSPLVAASSIMLFGTWRAAYLTYGLIGLGFFLLIYTTRVQGEKDLSFRQLGSLFIKSTEPASAGPSPSPSAKTGAPSPFYISLALLLLFVGSILSGFIFRGSLTFLPALFQQNINSIANHDQPMVMAGYTATAVLSLGLIGAWFGGYINDKIKRPELVPIFIFLVTAPALYYASRLMDKPLIVATGLFSLVYYAWQPSQNYLIAKYTKKSSHGMGFGVNFFLIFGMGSLATSAGGWVADGFGVDRFYAILAAIALAGMLTAVAVYSLRSYAFNFRNKIFKLDD